VRILGNIDAEVKRFIAAHVSGEIASPASQKAKVIDVANSIDAAWTGV
jgi:butyrate kinase